MLQIASGKLFTAPVGRENHIRGIIYSNAILAREDTIFTAAGSITSSSNLAIRPNALIYELVEKMEEEEIRSGVLVSSGIEPYLQDFSILLSFALNCTCTPDIDLARRLTNGSRGLSTKVSPRDLVHKFFDDSYWCNADDIELLQLLTSKVISLPRLTFLGVMRAIRTYINGMHRIGDDLELAYTLLVASVESLAQTFDGHVADWESIDDRKRKKIDTALSDADELTASRVRMAFLEVEHVALRRRFIEFSINFTPKSYFRTTTGTQGLLLSKSELSETLGLAYQSRSKYVHQIERLPAMVTMEHNHSEVAMNGRSKHLTLQGLSRLMRSVIIEFIMQQPSIDREPYNYNLEREGVIQLQLSPEYYIWIADGDIENNGREKLEGFLSQFESIYLKRPNSSLTDMRQVLIKSIEFIPKIKKELRRPYLALQFIFNLIVSQENKVTLPKPIIDLMEKELDDPSPEALIAHCLSGQIIEWPLHSHRQTLDIYFRKRSAKGGLRFSRTFEAAITLDLAERYRAAGDIDTCLEMIELAVDNHPGNVQLLEFENEFDSKVEIKWHEILRPVS